MAKTDQLSESVYFSSPVYSIEIPEWVSYVNKVCDKYIKEAKKNNIKNIKEREKAFNKKTSWNILNHMGYNLNDYELFFTEFWVQEFAEKGGGHHEGHIHYDNHISGFYFLKCSEKTSIPVFHDPRHAKIMTQLPLKKEIDITLGTHQIHYKPKPGTMIFFPAYMEHQYLVDNGIEPFRFIHFNLQAVRRMITDTVRKQVTEQTNC